MRGLIALVLFAACLFMAVAFKAIRQEFNIRRMNSQILVNGERAKGMEDEILTNKLKMQQLNTEMTPLKNQIEGLTKKKEQLKKASVASETGQGTCNKQKVESEQKEMVTAEALEKLKIEQESEEQKALEEIENLQKQILDRDVAVCAFLDQKQEEGRKLCKEKQNGQIKS
ncbi:uncharacterized protein si:dkey-87o1.2 [Trichomycterus rosablanca]|uniref:uncharacterized protein si:dkey-87o1.2 n=1 Tax=Trichomycterus rosablanca TaxID=2290929 RepID=UPI002F35B661